MLKKLIVTMAMMLMVTVASAGTITVALTPVATQSYPDLAVDPTTWLNAGYLVYDLTVTVDSTGDPQGVDQWTTAHCTATLTNAAYFEHPIGGDKQPNTALFPAYGMMRYDSFWTVTEEWPNPDLDPGKDATTFAPGSPLQKTPTVRECEWYADPEVPNIDADGTYTIARYAFLPSGKGWELHAVGETYLAHTGGQAYPFDITVTPEPASIALLVLGAIGFFRRR